MHKRGGEAEIGFWTLIIGTCSLTAAWAIRFTTKA
jgi:hypothetical protein